MRISDWSSDVCSSDLTYQRYQQGVLPLFPLGNANAELELLKSQLAEAEADTAVLLDALAILAGQIPGTTDEALKQIFDVPLPPEQVAVGDPSNLVARRPDIRAAERSLAAATARIGVAEAARFPKLSFMGILGLGGTSPDDLFDVSNPSILAIRSEEHTSELQSLMRTSYAFFCLKKKKN